ncbi:hypothetical protein DQP55_19710 [Mycolicibacterium sp. GF69]|nr:hypothetical protein DQP55_19710 [Mycolicibacterium sp. GF69]
MLSTDGPAWSAPGTSKRTSRYPLAVEAPVLRMVSVLVPGISTLSDSALHFALYWALADFASAHDSDAAGCRTLIRRAESALAWASLISPTTGDLSGPGHLHGADTVRKLLADGLADRLSEVGAQTYSDRVAGFWSQYIGPATTVGLVTTDKNALRVGRRRCPDAILDMFAPLTEIIAARPVTSDDLPDILPIAHGGPSAPYVAPLREVMTASGAAEWTGDDQTRRATLRIFCRAVQLQPGQSDWRRVAYDGIAYGEQLTSDVIFQQEGARAAAWRGLLLRHRFVGAWRLWWARLVDEVREAPEPVQRNELHDWVREQMPEGQLGAFLADLPPTVDAASHPLPAEDDLAERGELEKALATLLLGARRLGELEGEALAAFRGGRQAPRRAYLDPLWVGSRASEASHETVRDFASLIVDDMLAQSHRIALSKLEVTAGGRIVLPTKLAEREGRYFALGTEGAYNIGFRAESLGRIAHQLGMLSSDADGFAVTEVGSSVMGLP